ncbi:MAG: hypothetical protein GX779_02375 [Clostridia bacterium]|nr:hypothetical protein [Clostridia bacterium]
MRTISSSQTPIIEAYVGEFASGKSENAINRALDLLESGRQVTLIDLDLVAPFYTLRPIQAQLKERGLNVVTWETGKTMGLGEAGSVLRPDMRWALRREGDIILDVGYGVMGTRTLNLVEGALTNPYLQVIAVINLCRPVTGSLDLIVDYVRSLTRVDGLLNNTHLGEETTLELVQEGARVVTQAAEMLELPVIATAAVWELANQMGKQDCMGNPVRGLRRFMPAAYW